jgi:hypothetical protein
VSPKNKWLVTGGIGAVLFGFGVCAVIECAFLKHNGYDWYLWAGLGTLSLTVLISGVVLLIKAGLLEKDIKLK